MSCVGKLSLNLVFKNSLVIFYGRYLRNIEKTLSCGTFGNPVSRDSETGELKFTLLCPHEVYKSNVDKLSNCIQNLKDIGVITEGSVIFEDSVGKIGSVSVEIEGVESDILKKVKNSLEFAINDKLDMPERTINGYIWNFTPDDNYALYRNSLKQAIEDEYMSGSMLKYSITENY